MYFTIDINVGRKGGCPVYHEMEDEDGEELRFDTEEEARAVMADEGLSDRAKVRRYVGGVGTLI